MKIKNVQDSLVAAGKAGLPIVELIRLLAEHERKKFCWILSLSEVYPKGMLVEI
jgi:hypothetical protein